MTSISRPLKSCPQDNSLDNFPTLQRVILLALQSQHTVAQIASAIDKDKSNVHKALRKLEKKGVVERAGSSYILSGQGHLIIQKRALSSNDSPLDRTTEAKSEEDIVLNAVDHHDISFNVLLWHIPEGWGRWLNTCCGLHLPEDHPAYPRELRRAARKFGVNKGLRGWEPVDITLYNGFSFQCHPKGVLVRIPAVVAESPSVAAGIAFKRLTSILPRIERWLKLEPTALYKQNRLNIKLITRHFALLEKEFVSWWVNIEGKRREEFIIKDEEGNSLWYMDKSHPWSIETSQPVMGELAANGVQDMLVDYKNDKAIRPKDAKARVEALESGVGHVGELLQREAVLMEQRIEVDRSLNVNMAAHIGLTQEVRNDAAALRETTVPLREVVVLMRESVQAQTALVGEFRAERLARQGGGRGWLGSFFKVAGAFVLGAVVFLRGWLR